MEHTRAWRPMGLLEIADRTFRLYRANFWCLFGISVVPTLFSNVMKRWLEGASPTPMAPHGHVLSARLVAIFFLVYLMPYIWKTVALTKAVADRYQGRSVTIRGAYASVPRRLFSLMIAGLVTYLLVYLGSALAVLPGIVFAIWCGFLIPVLVVEDRTYGAAVWRSKFLVGQGVWVRWLALFVLVFAVGVVMEFAVGAAFLVPIAIAGKTSSIAVGLHIVSSTLAVAIAEPIFVVGVTLLYFDSRIRKEGFDLQLLAQEMGTELPPTTETSRPEDSRDHTHNGVT